ncbi:DHH family phosphoesterase [Merdibacter massiliensis]|uniref:DHH family phosphoesterase n=1 Tax=Merdibacter massiliensis TaxID=1871030 RepID=UPI001F3104F7|nr:bifunctional oligoribonuclease/PAP phosphatase NrnA [Merdibacter massiliensis]
MMKEKAKWLIDAIESFDSIVIFRHVLADADALGSQFGLKTWIQERYPEKQVFAIGNSVGASSRYFPCIDQVDDAIIARSLAIILDTSNAARIDDARWQTAVKKIRIDHHIFVEKYCDEELVQPEAAATCEILALLLKEHGEILSKSSAQYLYSGLIADTINFTISSTSTNTLQAAAYLISFGVDVVQLQMQHFGTSLKDFYYENWLRSQMKFQDGVGYALAKKSDFERFGLTFQQAKEKVFVFSGVFEIKVWALFTQMESVDHEEIYTCSLRSRNIALNDIANNYGGGGHQCACGIKNLTADNMKDLLRDLQVRVREISK